LSDNRELAAQSGALDRSLIIGRLILASLLASPKMFSCPFFPILPQKWFFKFRRQKENKKPHLKAELTLNDSMFGDASSDAGMSLPIIKERSKVPDCAANSRLSDKLRSRNFLDIPNRA
jgi:hypothetical protein